MYCMKMNFLHCVLLSEENAKSSVALSRPVLLTGLCVFTQIFQKAETLRGAIFHKINDYDFFMQYILQSHLIHIHCSHQIVVKSY